MLANFNTLYHCSKCGKEFGRTNLAYKGCEIWVTCDCGEDTKLYFMDLANIIMPPIITVDFNNEHKSK